MGRSLTILLVVFGVLLVAAFGFSMLMGSMMGPDMMPDTMSGQGWRWGLGMALGGLTVLAFWGALIVGTGLLVRALGGARRRRWQHSPLDILKRRYAAGEITKEQYEQMRSDIDSD